MQQHGVAEGALKRVSKPRHGCGLAMCWLLNIGKPRSLSEPGFLTSNPLWVLCFLEKSKVEEDGGETPGPRGHQTSWITIIVPKCSILVPTWLGSLGFIPLLGLTCSWKISEHLCSWQRVSRISDAALSTPLSLVPGKANGKVNHLIKSFCQASPAQWDCVASLLAATGQPWLRIRPHGEHVALESRHHFASQEVFWGQGRMASLGPPGMEAVAIMKCPPHIPTNRQKPGGHPREQNLAWSKNISRPEPPGTQFLVPPMSLWS